MIECQKVMHYIHTAIHHSAEIVGISRCNLSGLKATNRKKNYSAPEEFLSSTIFITNDQYLEISENKEWPLVNPDVLSTSYISNIRIHCVFSIGISYLHSSNLCMPEWVGQVICWETSPLEGRSLDCPYIYFKRAWNQIWRLD